MYRKAIATGFAMVLLALPALAQDSKLNGTWKLNPSKSNFGQFPPPTSEVDTLTVKGNDFKQEYISTTARGDQKGLRSCTVDGKEVTLTPDDTRVNLGGIKLSKMQCSWEGSAVVFLETANLNGSPLTDKLTFSPSDDGATMTMTSHITSATINADRKFVYEKADASAMMAAPAAGAMAATPAAASMMHMGSGQPNFSGTWKLNTSKSSFGQLPPPASQVDTIDHTDPNFKVSVQQTGGMNGDSAYTTTLRTDGQEVTAPGSPATGGAPITSAAKWEGAALVVNSKLSVQGADVKIKDSYTLSADGKMLTESTHVESGMGNFDITQVYDKQ
jgi:hypothetical protein